MKRVLTSTQAAKACKVATRTLTGWIDSGKLRGYRIPGSRDRRVPVGELVRFCKQHGLPVDDILGDVEFRVLLIGDVPELDGEFVTRRAATAFDAGIECEAFKPDAVVIDLAMGVKEAVNIASRLTTPVIATAYEDHPEAILPFGEVFRRPFPVAALNESLDRMAGAKWA
jgi:two-component system response regulator RpaA